jgi:hypothetical protein
MNVHPSSANIEPKFPHQNELYKISTDDLPHKWHTLNMLIFRVSLLKNQLPLNVRTTFIYN